MTRRGRSGAAAWVAAALALGGCGIVDLGDDGAERDLRRARALWVAADLDDYDLRQQRRCFCADLGLVRVEVRDGIRVATVLVEGEGTLHPSAVSDYPTVEELFGLVERAVAGSVDEVRVTYHPVLGYPVDLWVDRSFDIADEEFGYVTELVAPPSGG